MRSRTETSTAVIVITTANTLRRVIKRLPPPVNPIRSTNSDMNVCPAVDATVKIATPTSGTICVCIAM